jgi:hypothetical protein
VTDGPEERQTFSDAESFERTLKDRRRLTIGWSMTVIGGGLGLVCSTYFFYALFCYIALFFQPIAEEGEGDIASFMVAAPALGLVTMLVFLVLGIRTLVLGERSEDDAYIDRLAGHG